MGTREDCIARRVEKAGEAPELAAWKLDALLDSIHVEAGTLPEALWRGRFCRPVDSRIVAAKLLREAV